jgi:hypothetical protein
MARVAIAYVEVRPDLTGFAGKLHAELAKVHAVKDVEIRADTKSLNASISKVARRTVKPIKQKIEPQIDRRVLVRGATDAMRDFGNIFGTGTIGRVISLSIKGAAGIIENFSEASVKAFDSMGTAMFDAANMSTKFGQAMAKVGTSMTTWGAEFASIVGALGGTALAAGAAGVALIALNVILGAVLAVVIPLVGGLTALVAQMAALGAVGAAGLGLVPGALAGILAAFGPLMLVMEKFKALFDKTTKAVGPLYEVFERLKNAIFAVVSTGFVKSFANLANTVLPKVLSSLLLVLGAWNRLITLTLKMVQTPAVIDAVNVSLKLAAFYLNLFADLVEKIAPSLLGLVTAAAPALQQIGTTLADVVSQFGVLFTVMNQAGNTQALFGEVADVLGRMLQIVLPLARLMMSWIVAILPVAQQFAGILSAMVTRWAELASSAQGQQMIMDFFLAMNQIVRDFAPVLEQVVTTFLQFGPTLAALTQAALPALQSLIDIFATLLTNMAPGIVAFLDQFSAMLADPAVQAAIGQLGTAVGTLVASLGGLKPETMTGIVNVFATLIRLTSSLVDTMWPLVDVVVQLAQFGLKNLEPYLLFLQASSMTTVKIIDWLTKKIVALGEKLDWVVGPAKAAGKWISDFAGKLGITSGKSEEMSKKVQTSTEKMTYSMKDFGVKTGAALDGAAAGVTGFANAMAWQTIIDNANAAATAIAQVGQTAFDTAQLGGE